MRIGIVSGEYPPDVGGVGDQAARLAAGAGRPGPHRTGRDHRPRRVRRPLRRRPGTSNPLVLAPDRALGLAPAQPGAPPGASGRVGRAAHPVPAGGLPAAGGHPPPPVLDRAPPAPLARARAGGGDHLPRPAGAVPLPQGRPLAPGCGAPPGPLLPGDHRRRGRRPAPAAGVDGGADAPPGDPPGAPGQRPGRAAPGGVRAGGLAGPAGAGPGRPP